MFASIFAFIVEAIEVIAVLDTAVSLLDETQKK